jgi:hypothetical protein
MKNEVKKKMNINPRKVAILKSRRKNFDRKSQPNFSSPCRLRRETLVSRTRSGKKCGTAGAAHSHSIFAAADFSVTALCSRGPVSLIYNEG